MAELRASEAAQYLSPIRKIVAKLEENDWETSHVSYIFWTLLRQWWEARVSYRTIFEAQGVLSELSNRFSTEISARYYMKREDNGVL